MAAWVATCAALAWSTAVRAQAIEVMANDDCVTERSLSAAMEQYRDRVEPSPALHARIRVSASSASFQLLRGEAVLAEREFQSLPERCAERVRAVAIALVLAFESVQARDRETPPEHVPEPEVQPSSAMPAQVEQPSEAPPAAPEQLATEESAAEELAADDAANEASEPEPANYSASWLALHAGGGVLIGALPEPALLVALGAGITLTTSLQLELTALASPGITHALGGGVVDAQLYGGQGALCLSAPLGALRALGCAGIAAAAVPARGRGFTVRDRSVLTGWAAALLAGALELALVGPVSARVFAGFYGSLVRPALEAKVDGGRRDATPFPLGGVLSLQVVWALP